MFEFRGGGRNTGKTDWTIRKAADTFGHIVCPNHSEAVRISKRAREMGLDIPFPLTFSEFKSSQFHPPGCRGFLFDNVGMLLQELSLGVPVVSATATTEETP